MSSYVDYFIVVEPEDIDAKRSDADPDNAVKFYFDPRRFMEYSHKIVYLPIRNLPHRKFSRNEQDNYENLRYIQNSLNRFF